jgi:hypothetical protein
VDLLAAKKPVFDSAVGKARLHRRHRSSWRSGRASRSDFSSAAAERGVDGGRPPVTLMDAIVEAGLRRAAASAVPVNVDAEH